MTNDEALQAVHDAAHANGIETKEALTAVLTGSFGVSLVIQSANITAEQLAELLVKGQVPAKVSSLEKAIATKQKEADAAAAVFRADIIALNEQIAALKAG